MNDAAVATHPLDTGCPPAWASEWGEDRYGVFVGFCLGQARQRFRWIPPGRFMMGSPESEDGRWADEDPRHWVELTEGIWLADTPCTQELWQEVMGGNPSHFQSPRRPVEQVSWEDCQDFVKALNERLPGLDVRLPTEAQWEYACRAGTETATWIGDLEILGASNAPRLDEIAWYSGNSGVDFDLEDGWDSSEWEEKQYDHHKAGTREVALKYPNPWGLYDMLGNVWEWCADWQGPYRSSEDVVRDPGGPDKGSNRVLRGGPWSDFARSVRAAARDWDPPGIRASDLGFRLSRGQGRGAAGGGAADEGREERGGGPAGDSAAGRAKP